MSPEVQEVLKEWSPPLSVNLAIILSAFFYWRGWRHLNRSFPNIFSTMQLAFFMSGLFALWIAIGSPLEAFDDELLSIHMVQHMLLMLVAPVIVFSQRSAEFRPTIAYFLWTVAMPIGLFYDQIGRLKRGGG